MSWRLSFGAAVLVGVLTPAASSAQPLPTTRPAVPELDVRVGALWPEEGSEPRPAFGLRLALRPLPTVASGRLSLQVTGDFRSFGGQEGYDDFFQVRRRITRNRFVFAGALGVDLLRTPRTTIDMRGGVALVRTRTNFQIDSSQGFAPDGNIWENVCAFEGFKERCSSTYEVTGLFAAGVRRTFTPGSLYFVGADYTVLGIGQQIFMGTFGIELR